MTFTFDTTSLRKAEIVFGDDGAIQVSFEAVFRNEGADINTVSQHGVLLIAGQDNGSDTLNGLSGASVQIHRNIMDYLSHKLSGGSKEDDPDYGGLEGLGGNPLV